MKSTNFYLELNLNGVIEVDPDRREEVLKKMSQLIQNIFKNESIIQFDSDIRLLSEEAIGAAIMNGTLDELEDGEEYEN